LEAAQTVAWRLEPEGMTVTTSENAAEVYGLPTGSSPATLVRLLHPDDVEHYQSTLTQAVERRDSYITQYRIIRPDNGETVWIEERGNTVCDADGKVRFVAGVSIDITARKLAEEKLLFQYDLTKNITDNATTAIFMMDASSRCTFMNPAAEKMTGYTFCEVENQLLHDLVHHHYPDGRPYPWKDCPLDRALPEHNEVRDHADVFFRKDGQSFPVICNAMVIRKEGVAIGTVIEVRDVTQEKEAAQELKRLVAELEVSADRKNQFLASLSHELRNPLAPIRTGLEIMRSVQDRGKIEELRCMMERQIKQLIRLIDDLLDVTRITQGRLNVLMRPVCLSEVIESAVEACRPFIDEKEQTLSIPPPRQIVVEADPNRLAQVLTNLLQNASKYTPKQGSIWLTVELQDKEVILTVGDSGFGIPFDKQTQIFEMFTQFEHPLEGYKGLGIGLSIARELVELHRGKIEVFSEGTNKGSEFRIRLPAYSEQALPTVQMSPKTVSQRALKVLIVDDNQAAADSLGMLIKLLGNDVRVVYDGLQAIDAAAQFRPHIVLMDLGMPGMDGYQAAQRIRAEVWGKGITLVALTGWGQEEDRARTKRAGFNYHLVKPAAPADLQKIFLTVDKAADR
jgi:PAS domain S-box-containing protein